MLREESTCLNRYKLPDELHAVCFHVGTDLFCHFLVKTPQKNGTHHHSDIQTQASQKPCTLQSHVGSTHNQSLARAVRQGEEVITEKRSLCKLQGPPKTSLFVLANTRADKFCLSCLFILPCNAEFFLSRDTWVSWPFSCSQHKSLCCVIGYLSFSVSCLLMKTQLRLTFSYALR